MELELDLSFFYGSTILPECILIFFLLIISILDSILEIKNKNLFFFYFFIKFVNKYCCFTISITRRTYY
jgi:hypothetical protein